MEWGWLTYVVIFFAGVTYGSLMEKASSYKKLLDEVLRGKKR